MPTGEKDYGCLLYTSDLAAVKAAAKDELDSYKDPADYREAGQAELAEAIAAGKVAIEAASDIDGVNRALAEAKAALDLIKTDAQLTACLLYTSRCV